MFVRTVAAAVAAAVAAGATIASAARVHSSPASVASKKVVTNARVASADEPYHLTLHLASNRLEELDDHVSRLAENEDGDDHGDQWLNDEQLKSYLAPEPKHQQAVQAWLDAHNITTAQWGAHGDRVSFTTTHGDVASKFLAPLAQYDLGKNNKVFRAESYTVPDELEDAVENITPLTSFLVPSPRHHVRRSLTRAQATTALDASKTDHNSCSDTFVSIECLRKHYGSYGFVPRPKEGETDLLIIGFGSSQAFSQSDLSQFLQQYRPDQANYTVATSTYEIGSATSEFAGTETMLDLELAVGLAAPLNVHFLLSGTSGDDMFLAPLLHVLDQEGKKPGVISVSYGEAESDLTKDDARRWYKTGLALAAQGTTVVFASGDNGLDEPSSNGGGQLRSCQKGINTPWPTTSSILVVGGTTGTNPEHAMNPLTDPQQNVAAWSGAGWSELNKAPRYQAEISKAYLDSLPSNLTTYVNKGGRGIADVSAYGEAIATVVSNDTQLVAGTSASAPIWAAHLALVNSALRAKGKKNVGFVHPKLYGSGQQQGAVKDITVGTTCGCPDVQVCFEAKQGWDPATGLGVPNFQGLLKLFGAA